MKHGPIALIDKTMPVVAICPKNFIFEKTFKYTRNFSKRGKVYESQMKRRNLLQRFKNKETGNS